MYIFVFEDGVSKCCNELADEMKDGFDVGFVMNIFDVSDPENIFQWNGSDFEELDVIES